MQPDTPAPIGADALREALLWTAAALQAVAQDRDTIRDPATGEARTVGQILDAADAALASAAQPDPAHQRAQENVALLADILNRRPALNAGLRDAYTHWTAEVYALMGAMAAEPANDAAAPKAAPAQPDTLPWNWLRGVIKGLPARVEPLGGQRTSYVQLDEVLGWLDEGERRASCGQAPAPAPAAVAEPSDDMVLAAARVQSPELFRHGLEPLPRDGEHTRRRMQTEAKQVRSMLAAAFAAAPQSPAVAQEPVGWLYDWVSDSGTVRDWFSQDYEEAHSPTNQCHNIRPLYTHPAPAAQGDAPTPDVQAKINSNTWDSLSEVLPVLKAASRGKWGWPANPRCKYIELRIDMRDGGCLIRDREGVRISPEQLAHQSHPGGLPWDAKAEQTSPPQTDEDVLSMSQALFAQRDADARDAERWRAWTAAFAEASLTDGTDDTPFMRAFERAIGDSEPPFTAEQFGGWVDAAARAAKEGDKP